MKQKLRPSHISMLTHCFEYVEETISRGWSYSEITKGLDSEFNDSIGTLRNLFSKYMPYSLYKYVKRRMLTQAYLQNKSNREGITTRDSFQGISQYSLKFRNEFGFSITGDYTEDQLQPPLDMDFLLTLNNALYKFTIVDDFKFIGDHIHVVMNKGELLKTFLSCKSFLLLAHMTKEYEQEKEENKILFLELSTRLIQGDSSLPSLDEIHQLISSAKLYDYDKCCMIGDSLLVFCPEIPAFLYETYSLICEELLTAIESVIPKNCIQHELANMLSIISDADSFQSISEQTGIRKSDAKILVWQFLKSGYLRYMTAKEVSLS